MNATVDREGVERVLSAHVQKELLRLVVVGSVDDGKSTLIGRLLYENDGLFEDQVRAVQKASAGGAIDFSLFTDGLKAEREQGITIDVAYRYFSTATRKVIIADTPGHVQYTRNMATGASTADAAVILVDARLGVLPQTRRHAYIASLLGIPHLAVCVNKMDLLGFDRDTFTRISGELAELAQRFGFRQVRAFPVSARDGDNITTRGERTPWHDGGTLLQWLESLPHADGTAHAPFRFPVQYVLRPDLDFRGFAGQVASGSVRVGDDVVVLPSGRRTRISAVHRFEGTSPSAASPESVTLRLQDEVDVARGDVIAHPEHAPAVTQDLDATLVWFSETPLHPGTRYLLKSATRSVGASVENVLWRKNLETLEEEGARSLAMNDVGAVRVTTRRPLVVDPYAENRALGAFILVDANTHDTVAAGMVLRARALEHGTQRGSGIGAVERAARLGHPGTVVVVQEDVAVARSVERTLFEHGIHAALVHDDVELASTLAGLGWVAVLHVAAPQRLAEVRAILDGGSVAWFSSSRIADILVRVKEGGAT